VSLSLSLGEHGDGGGVVFGDCSILLSVQACSILLSVNGDLLLDNGDSELLGLTEFDSGDCSLLLAEPRLDPEAAASAS
jgi:hypothetical protein